MALRTGIQPSELMKNPFLYAAIVEELMENDTDAGHTARRDRLTALATKGR